jgi:alanyl-tRNA synthetase
MDELVVIVGAVFGGKPHLAVMVSDKLIQSKKLNAGEIVRTAAREFNGGGGGQPFFATAGGKDADKLDLAMNKASELVLQAI